MKKYFFIAVAALAASAACSKVETFNNTPDSLISFKATSYVATKAAGDTVSVLSEFDAFKCKAFLHADGYENETQDFFGAAGETISYNGSDSWLPSHPYYWPKSSQSYINFVAWYDKNSAPTTATETELSWSARTIDPADTILFADEAWRYKDNVNPATFGKDGVTEGVPMLFHHALAQLNIKAKATKTTQAEANGVTSWKVLLDTVKLVGAYTKGTLTLTQADPTTNKTQAWTVPANNIWTSPADAADVVMQERLTTGAEADSLTTEPAVLIAGRNVLPQNVSNNDDLKMKVVYSIFYKFNGVQYAKERIATEVALKDFSTAVDNWEMNHKITYTVIIDPETKIVKLDPAMVEWYVDDAGEAELEN